MIIVLEGPDGVGKTTLTKKLADNNKNFIISISHTTRRPRPNEKDGKDYYFVDKEKFDSLIKSGVSKSGSPKLKEIISCPSAFNSRLIRAIASVADSANRFSLSETSIILMFFFSRQR